MPGRRKGNIVCCKIEKYFNDSSVCIKSHLPRWQLYSNVPFTLNKQVN